MDAEEKEKNRRQKLAETVSAKPPEELLTMLIDDRISTSKSNKTSKTIGHGLETISEVLAAWYQKANEDGVTTETMLEDVSNNGMAPASGRGKGKKGKGKGKYESSNPKGKGKAPKGKGKGYATNPNDGKGNSKVPKGKGKSTSSKGKGKNKGKATTAPRVSTSGGRGRGRAKGRGRGKSGGGSGCPARREVVRVDMVVRGDMPEVWPRHISLPRTTGLRAARRRGGEGGRGRGGWPREPKKGQLANR